MFKENIWTYIWQFIPFFRSFRQDSIWDFNVQPLIHQDGLPTNFYGIGQNYFEAQVRGYLGSYQKTDADLTITILEHLIISELTFSIDRGLCWNPHTAALCHEWHTGGMGNIRNTTEALGPVIYCTADWTCWNEKWFIINCKIRMILIVLILENIYIMYLDINVL